MKMKIQELLEITLKEELDRTECIRRRESFCPIPPNHFYVEPTNRCFLNCVMCSDKATRGAPGDMSFDLWKRIVDSLAKYNVHAPVNIIGRGEPTANRNLPEFVEYAQSKNVECAIITNGALMDKKFSTRLLKAGIKKIQFSLHAHSRETYENITGVDCYKKVKQNLLDLVELNSELKTKCYINVMSVESSYNKHESQDFKDFWTPLVDRCFVTPLYSIQGGSKLAQESVESIKGDKKIEPHKGCAYPWFFMTFRHDGNINPCPYDFKTKFSIGNANDPDYDLMKVWNCEKMLKLRQNHLDREYSYCLSEGYDCANCELPYAKDTYKGLDQYVDNFHIVYSREFAPILKDS